MIFVNLLDDCVILLFYIQLFVYLNRFLSNLQQILNLVTVYTTSTCGFCAIVVDGVRLVLWRVFARLFPLALSRPLFSVCRLRAWVCLFTFRAEDLCSLGYFYCKFNSCAYRSCEGDANFTPEGLFRSKERPAQPEFVS